MYPTRFHNPAAVGFVLREFVRCGKPRCRCARERGHEAYYLAYRVFERGEWRRRKRYIPRADVPRIRRQLAEAKARDRAMTGLLQAGRVLRAAIQARSRGGLSDRGLEEIADAIDQG